MSDMGCRSCDSYNRGAGTKNCFKCQRYQDVCLEFTDRETIRVIHVPSALIEEVADRAHEDKGMLWAVRKLDPKDMACILLQYYGKCSIDEIAEAMGVTGTVIDRRLHRSRKILEQIISERNHAVETPFE